MSVNLVAELHAIVAALRGAGIRYAGLTHMKRLAGRPQDLADLELLEAQDDE